MKGLEALENIKSLFVGSPIDLSRQFDIIEKELKWIEVIKSALKKGITYSDGRRRFDIPAYAIDIRLDKDGELSIYYDYGGDLPDYVQLPKEFYGKEWFIQGEENKNE